MLDKIAPDSDFINKYAAKCVMASVLFAAPHTANAINAEFVLNEMNEKQRHAYIAGVVGGLAYSRFLRDKPDETSMECVQDWFYGSGKDKWIEIEQWFSRHAEKPVEPLLYVLIKRKCGE